MIWRTHFIRVCLALTGVGMLAACSASSTPESLAIAPTDSPQRAAQIASDPDLMGGRANYDLLCAHCHGYGGEGQIASTVQNTRSLGMNTVPPHNATGHTWQHPDQLLIAVIRQGIQNPLDHYPMRPFEGVMTADEITQVLKYIRLWWTDEQRAYQTQLTENRSDQDREFGINDS